ncbi:hypothetical protein QQ045_007935 [Rhodiola kirilowii]
MGIPIPHIAIVFAPMQVQVQRTLTVERSFDDIKTQNFKDLRSQLETMREDNQLDLPHNYCFFLNNKIFFAEFVTLEDYKLKNNDVLQVTMVDLGT